MKNRKHKHGKYFRIPAKADYPGPKKSLRELANIFQKDLNTSTQEQTVINTGEESNAH